MKKLMIAAAIVCAAVASQAAAINWKSGGNVKPDGQTVAGNNTLTLSVFILKDIDGGMTAAEQYAALSLDKIWDIYGQETTKAMTDSADYSKTGSGSFGVTAQQPSGDVSKSTTYYAVIVGTYNSNPGTEVGQDDLIEMYTVNKYAASVNDGGSLVNAPNNLLLYINGDSAAGNVKWESVPEPTSGLLLLLGVAGLALRRRRA